MSAPLENLPSWAIETGWVVLAIAVHAALLGVMPRTPAGAPPSDSGDAVAVAIVDEDVLMPEPEPAAPEEPAPEEAPDPEPVEPPRTPKTFKAPKETPQKPKEPPAAAPETPVSFDNLVLTNEEGGEPSSWAIDPASGESREGPIGRPGAVVTGRSRDGVAGGVVGGTGTGLVVDVGDLSKRPIPPSLKQKLEKLYPKKARQEGVEGEVVLRLQVGPDGLPSKIRIVSESPEGYELGRACVRTLEGEKWQPPIGKEGKPVTTRVTYRCGFEIRY